MVYSVPDAQSNSGLTLGGEFRQPLLGSPEAAGKAHREAEFSVCVYCRELGDDSGLEYLPGMPQALSSIPIASKPTK